MHKTATIVHLDALTGATPLVGGYLKAYALACPDLRRDWRIELYSASASVQPSTVLRHLVRGAPDLVAFSVYTWNAGLVAKLLPALRGLLPGTRFLLGGVEVMNVAERWIERDWENVAVCNGEGERTFRDLLRELGEREPCLERVSGISFARDGAWCTTEGQLRIQDLSELPSPWLSGVFDDCGPFEVALFETNRGCPFACEFCYWGGAVGQKVYRQDLERIRDEIDAIVRLGIPALALCDANFGILPQDVAIAEHIAAASRALRADRRGLTRVVFNSSKVHPERVEAISRTFSEARLLTRHVFSMQSMDEHTLTLARRTSMQREPYRAIQRRLNAERMASIVELVWPLPGETLESYKDGVDELCRMGAQGFLVYPLLWLNNTGYAEHTADYGVVTLPESDPASGGRIVVATREVPFEDYLEGLRFALALHLLHDCRGLFGTLALLDALGIERSRDALDAFARWLVTQASGPLADEWRVLLEGFEQMAGYLWRGTSAEAVLAERRQDFDRLLVAFVASQPHWTEHEHGDLIRAALEHDLLCRPYFFLQTPFELGVELETLQVLEARPRLWRVRCAWPLPRLLDDLRAGRGLDSGDLRPGEHELVIDHRGLQLFVPPSRPRAERLWVSTQAIQEVVRFEPRCAVEPVEHARASVRSS